MILAYIKGFLTLFLLIKVLLYFVPKKVFGKYIAFFSGVKEEADEYAEYVPVITKTEGHIPVSNLPEISMEYFS